MRIKKVTKLSNQQRVKQAKSKAIKKGRQSEVVESIPQLEVAKMQVAKIKIGKDGGPKKPLNGYMMYIREN